MVKVCVITCYDQPDYIRARTLRAAFGLINNVEVIVVKNTSIGVKRYFEVMWRIITVRLTQHPDIYLLTFRGYEMLLPVCLLTLGKPFVFDEFINLIEWVVYEHHKIKPGSFVAGLLRILYKIPLMMTNLIVSDTPSHAAYSAKIMKLPLDKYMPLIVSTDEDVFRVLEKHTAQDGPFRVFYYGSMLPLQGVEVIIEAIRLLKDTGVELTLIGGKDKIVNLVEEARADGVPIVYKKWVEFEELPNYISAADVCLGGPFGGTTQAQFVIGGKTFQFLSMGRPVIIGRNEESHLWTDKKDALIVEQANPRALADAILWAKNHPSRLKDMATAGGKLYKDKLSNKVLAQQLRLLLAHEHVL